jgi:hypothetical protein
VLEQDGRAEDRQQEAHDLRDGELEKESEKMKSNDARGSKRQRQRDTTCIMISGLDGIKRVEDMRRKREKRAEWTQKIKETCHNIMYIYFYD